MRSNQKYEIPELRSQKTFHTPLRFCPLPGCANRNWRPTLPLGKLQILHIKILIFSKTKSTVLQHRIFHRGRHFGRKYVSIFKLSSKSFKKPLEWNDTLNLLLLMSFLAHFSTLKTEVICSCEMSDCIRPYNPRYHTPQSHRAMRAWNVAIAQSVWESFTMPIKYNDPSWRTYWRLRANLHGNLACI
jgi:hypothetical protein